MTREQYISYAADRAYCAKTTEASALYRARNIDIWNITPTMLRILQNDKAYADRIWAEVFNYILSAFVHAR